MQIICSTCQVTKYLHKSNVNKDKWHPNEEWVFVDLQKFGVSICCKDEQSRQQRATRNAYPGKHY